LVTSDPWVLDMVTNGLKIDFVSHPIQRMPPRDLVMSEEMQAVCDAEVASWICLFLLLNTKESRGISSYR
jgi:hypothetical protein